MRRVLLISYVFPPEPPTGALRAGYLARYLPEYGWDVTVLTHSVLPPPFQTEVVRARTSRWLEALPFRLRDSLFLPDATAMWIPAAIASGIKTIRSEHFDAIVSTAHPPSVHVVGWTLAKIGGLPWLADFRDPWSGTYRKRGPVRTFLEQIMERALLRRANLLTTVDDTVAEHLRRFHRRSDVLTFANAHDPANWEGIPDVPVRAFELCHAGRMYDQRYSPEILLEALAQLRTEGDPAGTSARLHFYGAKSAAVLRHAERLGISDAIVQHGTVPRREAMEAQRRAAALLIFQPMNAEWKNEMGSKYLEYLGARRRIITIGVPDGIMGTFLTERDLGWYASDSDQAKNALRAAYARFIADDYAIQPDTSKVLSARDLAVLFAERLDALTTGALGYSAVA